MRKIIIFRGEKFEEGIIERVFHQRAVKKYGVLELS